MLIIHFITKPLCTKVKSGLVRFRVGGVCVSMWVCGVLESRKITKTVKNFLKEH
jgi:hypothetical protein